MYVRALFNNKTSCVVRMTTLYYYFCMSVRFVYQNAHYRGLPHLPVLLTFISNTYVYRYIHIVFPLVPCINTKTLKLYLPIPYIFL